MVLTMGGGAPPAVANVRDELQPVAQSSPAQGRLDLVVAVPERFTGTILPEGSFTAIAGDQRLAMTATAIPAASLSVLVIIDTGSTVPAASFDRQRAAVAELARAVEPGTRLGLATTTSPFRLLDATDDRSALLTALGNVARGGTASPVEALAAAASLAASAPGTRIVLFADDPATLTDQLLPAAGGAPTDVVRSGRSGATTSHGVLRVHHVDHPLQFVDSLAAGLTGQYRLAVTLPEPTPEAVTVRLNAGGLAFELPVTLSTATPAAGSSAGASTPTPTVAAVSQSRTSPSVAAPPTTSSQGTPSVSATAAAQPTAAPTTQGRPASEGDDTDTSLLFWVAVIATPVGLALMIIAVFARRSASRPRRRRRTRRARRASPAKAPLLVPRPASIDGDEDAEDAGADDDGPLLDDDLVDVDPLFEVDPLVDDWLADDDRREDDALQEADQREDAERQDAALSEADGTEDDARTEDDDLPSTDEPSVDEEPAGFVGPLLGTDVPAGADALVDDPAPAEHDSQPLPRDDPPVPPDAVTSSLSVVPVEHRSPGTTQAHRHARQPQRWPARRVASVTMMVASDILLRRRHHRP